ncbi:hypothetical protein B0J13DRAFT_567420 [Dactylonectria estremocensis]|uniref:Uncharacterized protein n=1 Tax=Dactylonectria estremocensis TaxID=1079267 RepID=A0A9P9DMA9_9HYPO|nr:hypothetical protein B0J13DRAFT_567420 [Dactylonectria estremocensis]
MASISFWIILKNDWASQAAVPLLILLTARSLPLWGPDSQTSKLTLPKVPCPSWRRYRHVSWTIWPLTPATVLSRR